MGATKKDRKIALLSFYQTSVPCMKIQEGYGSPTSDAHVPKTYFKYSKSIAQ